MVGGAWVGVGVVGGIDGFGGTHVGGLCVGVGVVERRDGFGVTHVGGNRRAKSLWSVWEIEGEEISRWETEWVGRLKRTTRLSERSLFQVGKMELEQKEKTAHQTQHVLRCIYGQWRSIRNDSPYVCHYNQGKYKVRDVAQLYPLHRDEDKENTRN